ncbi:MAG: hypothetical protein ACRC2R_14660 [Xenococcaceae cyanobacterium]
MNLIPVRNLGARIEYSPEFSAVPVSSPNAATEKERLAFWLSIELPLFPDHKTIQTIDHIWEWLHLKDWVIRIAKIFSGMDEPLTADLKTGAIDRLEHDLNWAQAKIFINLWELLSNKWQPIKQALDRYGECPYNDPVDLFKQIIGTELTHKFSTCLKNHFNFSASETKKFNTLLRRQIKGGFLTQKEQLKLSQLHAKYCPPNLWWTRLETILLDVFNKKADPLVEAYWQIYDVLLDTTCKLTQRLICQGSLSSVTWVDGNLLPGSISVRKLEKQKIELHKS